MKSGDLLDNLNQRFDHAALKPDTTESDIIELCRQAKEYNLFAVAVNPVWVNLARQELADTEVRIVSVAGFPLGASKTDIKVAEAVRGVSDGAHEIDMVANIAWLLDDHFEKVEQEISAVRKNLPYNVVLKAIVEAGKLTQGRQEQSVEAVVGGGLLSRRPGAE
jgi:deoxyribose-phosphate aldolase